MNYNLKLFKSQRTDEPNDKQKKEEDVGLEYVIHSNILE